MSAKATHKNEFRMAMRRRLGSKVSDCTMVWLNGSVVEAICQCPSTTIVFCARLKKILATVIMVCNHSASRADASFIASEEERKDCKCSNLNDTFSLGPRE